MAALRRLDPGVEDVAASLGRGPWRSFFRVMLPAISPAVLGGALLVGLHLLGEYGALQLLNYPTLTTGILDQYATVFNGPAATLLAGGAGGVLPRAAAASSCCRAAAAAGPGSASG